MRNTLSRTIESCFDQLKQLQLVFLFLLLAQAGFAQETKLQYLSGTDKDHTVEWDFMISSGRNSNKWSKIPVPSNWEFQGFGNYNYGWEKNDGEDGFYKYSFKSNPDWANKIVQLVFEGSMTDTEVKVNGKSAGALHQGGFYRFKYDVTKLLNAQGDNLLEVTVHKVSADTSVNRAERQSDFWVFGGIFRPVYLEILPQQFINNIAIDAKADGAFLMNIYPANIKSNATLEAQIYTLDGKPVGDVFTTSVKAGQDKITLKTKIDAPNTWTAEYPNRYKVELKLKDGGHIAHQLTEKFGFRTIELREGVGFFVNGKKIMFKGTNRHTFWPTTGRTTSKEISIMDINLMKDMNMNSVRMSHYPPDTHFLDACDSLGLFVLDELTGWQKKYDTPVGRKLVKEMIVKDVNHPSIVMWDNGNEGGNNHEIVDDYAIYDPQNRPVIHPWNIFRGTDTQHYKGYGCCVGSLYNGNTVFFPTEILHGLYDGGHGAGLNDHWNLMLSNPLSAGCFLWVFADEGVVRQDENNRIDTKGNLAPDGIVGPYREKEGSFYTIKEIWSPVHIGVQKLLKDFTGVLAVENRYFYTNLNTVTFNWKLTNLPGPWDKSSEGKILKQGQFKGPDIAPQKNGELNLNLPTDFAGADVLYLTATDLYGRELYTWSWPLKSAKQINETLVSAANSSGKIVAKEDQFKLKLSANGVQISFDKATGTISDVRNNKSVISFNNGPLLAGGKGSFKSFKHYTDGKNYVIECNYEGEFKRAKYIFQPNGILKLDYAYRYDNRTNSFLGLNFNYPEEKITGVKYLGRGPYRVWKNRMKGNEFNIFNKKYNNTITGESWNYPEFKGFYRDFNWVVIENKEAPFAVYTDTPDLFLRLYTPTKPIGAKNDNNSPPFPEGDISFLNGISAIGTKFDGAENHGPEGQKNKTGDAYIEGVLYFDFRAATK